MKLTTLVLGLPLAASAGLISRQNVPTVNRAGKPLEVLQPQMRKDAKRAFFTVSTYTLKGNPRGGAASADAGHSHGGGGMLGGMGGGMMGGESDTQTFNPFITGSKFCGDCTVLAGQIRITYADGSYANVTNGVYVHHILTNGPSKGSFVSGSGTVPMGSGFVGAGDDNGNTPFIYTPRDGSIESGFQISPSDSFTANMVFVNYNKDPRTIYVHYDLEYLPGKKGRPVKSALLSAANILTGPKTSKMGAVNTTGSPMTFTDSGDIIFAKGHLHDGGSAMYMKIEDNMKTIFSCVSRATYGGKIYGTNSATISDMTDCNKSPVKIAKGNRLIMTAEYDLKAHPLRQSSTGGEAGGMGMFRMIFAPSAPLSSRPL